MADITIRGSSVPTMPFAEVAVNSRISRGSSTFHYSIPPTIKLQVGHLVWVPFGHREMQGIVLQLLASTDVSGVKDVASVIDQQPMLSAAQVQLARWISDRYGGPVFEAIRLMLPPGVERHLVSVLELTGVPAPADLTTKQRALMELLSSRGRLRIDQLKAVLRMTGLSIVIGQLTRRGLVKRDQELHGRHVAPKRERYLSLVAGAPDGKSVKGAKQALVLEVLRERGAVVQSELVKELGVSVATIGGLVDRGLVVVSERPVRRNPLAGHRFSNSTKPRLTDQQVAVWHELSQQLMKNDSSVTLLYGVTGSGKTEIYLRAIERCLESGKTAIMLVPEIALTPQTIHRFASRFPGAIAVLHSKLSEGEQFDEWHRIRQGVVSVVIGPRSAIFAPLASLGIIILDEEHEWSYKQEQSPRYHAREVAVKLGELTGAKVLLGSATPDVVTFHRAKEGRYRLLQLPQRVVSTGPSGEGQIGLLPEVQVVDMRSELRRGNRTIFSGPLRGAMSLALAAKEQVILFLNRRGTATFVMCRDCGHVLRCRRCDVSFVYHGDADELVCHQCNLKSLLPDACPDCWSQRIRFFGAGTQKVEEEVRRQFPQARVLRWDRDVTGAKNAHEELMRKFVAHEADIMVGTQMIAKGLDLPLVTLVGVISADTALNLPDIRAFERTFQLLTQVAGRAGRGRLAGRVVVQTYSPEHYCIQAASKHDYLGFYSTEIEFRRKHAYPPFGRLARVLFSHGSEAQAQQSADRLADTFRLRIVQRGIPATSVIGPAPAYHKKLRGKFRWQLLIRGPHPEAVFKDVPIPLGAVVDIDPLTLL